MLLLLLACIADPVAPSAEADLDHLVRASMAVRGIRPLPHEVRAYLAAPDQLEVLVRVWLRDPRFGESVRDQHAELLHLRTSAIGKIPPVGPLSGRDLGDIARNLDEAPLMLVQEVVTEGRPYTELLTTDRTWADPIVARVHGLAHDPSGPEWQPTTWADGRPAAGLLADTAILQRYMSSNTNYHRARAANALAAFVCEDLLTRSAAAPPTLVDPSSAESAVRSDPACLGCHALLDPVASAFWGMHPYILSSDVLEAYQGGCAPGAPCLPLPFWDPTATGAWSTLDLPAPAWNGQPVADLAGLGQAIAADPDFAVCTARRFHAWHTGRPVDGVAAEVGAELADVLVTTGFDARELVVASVLHPDLAAAPPRTIRPEELARTVEALTGYVWEADPDAPGCQGACYGLTDLARGEAHGFRTLLGGTDGWDVTDPAAGPAPTQALALQWLAEEAAAAVVATDAALPRAQRRLFSVAGPEPASEAEVRAQLAHLHLVVLTEPLSADDPVVDDTFALFRQVEALGGVELAWRAVVAALLQDHRLVVF